MKKYILGLLGALLAFQAQAQPAPSSIPGCVYLANTITLTNRQTTPWHCDINGKLLIDVSSASLTGPAGGSLSGTYPNPTLAAVNSIAASLAIGGATIGPNALAVTGTAQISDTLTLGVAGNGIVIGGTVTGNELQFGTAGGGAAWKITASNAGQHIYAITDQAHDIGAVSTSRPRSLYLGTSLNIGPSTTVPAILTSPGASALQFGGTDSASPVAQTLQFQNAATANISAVDATIKCPLATGTSKSGRCLFYTGIVTASGSASAVPTLAMSLEPGTQIVSAATGYSAKGQTGIVSCTAATLGATVQVIGGIITAFTGC